jgi:hypothetical protein
MYNISILPKARILTIGDTSNLPIGRSISEPSDTNFMKLNFDKLE